MFHRGVTDLTMLVFDQSTASLFKDESLAFLPQLEDVHA